jgi:glucosamine-6-phosphate deaminase
MQIRIFDDKNALGREAATQAATIIRRTLAARGTARILVATGGSQFEFLEALTQAPGLDWAKVEMFHLDEYVGLSIDHPASLRKFLLDRLIRKTGIRNYHLLDGEAPPETVCRDIGRLLNAAQVDVAFPGIGENGHLAFNDPPADFQNEEPYLIVNLDEACRRQQVGEGWFAELSEVPRQAISMSIRQIMKAREIIVVVPDPRKAAAARLSFEGEINPMAPASILRTHANATVYLDKASASLLSPETLAAFAAAA